jgi:hypothetical protein
MQVYYILYIIYHIYIYIIVLLLKCIGMHPRMHLYSLKITQKLPVVGLYLFYYFIISRNI